jgi:hypothetical protein
MLQIRIAMLKSTTVIYFLYKLKIVMSVLILSSINSCSCVYKIKILKFCRHGMIYVRLVRLRPSQLKLWSCCRHKIGTHCCNLFSTNSQLWFLCAASWWLCYRYYRFLLLLCTQRDEPPRSLADLLAKFTYFPTSLSLNNFRILECSFVSVSLLPDKLSRSPRWFYW